MANIKLHELSYFKLSGTELFNDSESFMTELSEDNQEMAKIFGGGNNNSIPTVVHGRTRGEKTIALIQLG